ncbi:type-F conjugative transfer system protein TraW [Parvularcula oceani]|uniref:type-F conjugative transfer system protein TraW n=1 Tax=Parvularcula oceani TaxID=1247963 RepID=UPI0004E0E26E|nr:type-F conjugative transfer system protein TraW [Parvularcula oceani]
MYRAIACAAWLGLSSEAAAQDLGAQDLGVRGQTFPVTEPDLFEEIAAKFAAMEASGEVDAVNRRLKERALASAERPPRIASVSATTEPRAFHFDPTVTLNADITTPNGQVIGRAGQRFNPLDYTPMRQRMIFFDGDDAAQVAWAKEEMAAAETLVSPILIGGPVLDLTRQWERQVFFDQGGRLTGRFGITQIPARVSRDGDLLLIEEVRP